MTYSIKQDRTVLEVCKSTRSIVGSRVSANRYKTVTARSPRTWQISAKTVQSHTVQAREKKKLDSTGYTRNWIY